MTDPVAADGVVVVECVEYGHIDIDPELWLRESHTTIFNSEIDGKDILRASFVRGQVRLQATSYVGVIPINDHVVVRVRPRVPIANLTRMVLETEHSVLPLSAFREYSSHGTADDWAMDLYTDALLDYVDDVLDRGLIRQYERHQDHGQFPHGRIEIGATIRRFAARGIPNKATYTWFERSVDTAPNRCLKAALEIVYTHVARTRAQPRRGDRSRLVRLADQLRFFDAVNDDDLTFLEDPQVRGVLPLPDPRSYYRPALDLAVLIVRGTGIALEIGDGDDVQLGSLLIDTNKLFEKYVRVTLARHAAADGWAADVLDGNTEGRVDLYDVPDPLPAPRGAAIQALAARDPGKAQPDVVVRSLTGTFLLIAEVKNTVHGTKNGRDVLPDRSEVEQAVTYALRYDLSFALLIHPWKTGTKGLVYAGRVRSIDVFDYRLDLSSHEGTDGALADMAAAVAQLAGLASS